MSALNPRSFASIKEALNSGEVQSRGQMARMIVNSFRQPLVDKRKKEIEEIEETGVETQPKSPSPPVAKKPATKPVVKNPGPPKSAPKSN